MECDETSDIYLGAQTEWLPAEKFRYKQLGWLIEVISFVLHQASRRMDCIKFYKKCRVVKNVGCIITNSDNQKENEMTSKNQIGVDKQKRFECSQCGKSFAKNSHIIEHLRIHSGEKPFECSQCGMKFTQKSNLTTHLRIHSDKKLFSCNQCRKAFTL